MRAEPPAADVPQRAFPSLTGRSVMLVPVQPGTPLLALPASADTAAPPRLLDEATRIALESELAFWLEQAAPTARWTMPEAVLRAGGRSAVQDVRPRALSVAGFARARLERIGDPLYGELRTLSLLTDARLALLPLGAIWVPEQGGGGRVHVAAALIDTLGGAVLWQGVVAGAHAAAPEGAAIASVAQALAALVPS